MGMAAKRHKRHKTKQAGGMLALNRHSPARQCQGEVQKPDSGKCLKACCAFLRTINCGLGADPQAELERPSRVACSDLLERFINHRH